MINFLVQLRRQLSIISLCFTPILELASSSEFSDIGNKKFLPEGKLENCLKFRNIILKKRKNQRKMKNLTFKQIPCLNFFKSGFYHSFSIFSFFFQNISAFTAILDFLKQNPHSRYSKLLNLHKLASVLFHFYGVARQHRQLERPTHSRRSRTNHH